MKNLNCYMLFFILNISCIRTSLSQNNTESNGSTDYRIETFGSAATKDDTPFWIVSNRYGVVPLRAGNGYLQAGIFHQQVTAEGIRWSAGLDLVATAPRYRNVYVQQIYLEAGYKCLHLAIGSKEKYSSLWDRRLSSGDMVHSSNARPIPEINISVPRFTTVPHTKG
ncbi:MAG: hypothetical protein LBF05_01970, partial [Tannerella sp.]|nr:hypothetical protein [Tannerella sp.]